MAVFVLLVVVSSSLSIFLPLVTDAVADYAAYCDSSGSGRSHAATARALVGDLKDKVPDKPGMQYCNVLTWPPSSGRQVFGYGSCDTVGRTADATYACRNCLATAGDALFLELSILLLITAAATTTGDVPHVQCYTGNGGVLAGEMKQSLILNLVVNLPYLPKTYYCNYLTFAGLTMYSFAECPRRDSDGDESVRACTDCLHLVGYDLIGSCGDTSTGYAWDDDSVCYFKVGYSLDVVCPKGTY
ncbi:unnamed protein product [Linum tenue]|uniref:Gnk2-homologous domain-containing protein n=1 Tax=Linum tenue TaxID=586396 RepID=A0AAV0N1H7_9ROSI|nr:unnamed protein product [Linum tenue]